MLRLLITIVGLVVDRGRGMISWGMVDNHRGSVVNCMVNSRGSMMDSMSTKGCEWNCWSSSHKGDKSN